jgi:ankyrin repeat protein
MAPYRKVKIDGNIFLFFRFGYSPLHIAALNEYSYCANMLLAYGADITAR